MQAVGRSTFWMIDRELEMGGTSISGDADLSTVQKADLSSIGNQLGSWFVSVPGSCVLNLSKSS